MKGSKVAGLVLGALALGAVAGCAATGGKGGFAEGERPKVEFFQLDIADRVQRVTQPRDAVEAYLKITNRSSQAIELYKVQARLRGQVVALTSTDLPSGNAPLRQGFFLLQQNIPPASQRIVRVKMTLASLESAVTSSGPLVPTLRGQLHFHTASGDTALAIEEKLTDLDASDPEED